MGRFFQHPPLSLNGPVSFLVAKNLHVKFAVGCGCWLSGRMVFVAPKVQAWRENSNPGWVGCTKTYLNSEFDYSTYCVDLHFGVAFARRLYCQRKQRWGKQRTVWQVESDFSLPYFILRLLTLFRWWTCCTFVSCEIHNTSWYHASRDS